MVAPMRFRLEWIDRCDGEPVFTMANLRLELGGLSIWPGRGEETVFLDCYAEDVLSYFTECWQPLLLRQSLPLPIDAMRPSELAAGALRRWAGRRSGEIASETAAVTAFCDAHNMALSFAGQFDLPPLWFFRQGEHMTIDTDPWTDQVPLADFVSAASDLGDEIAARLEGLENGRWARLIGKWRSRDQGDPVTLQALATDLDQGVARQFIEEDLLDSVSSVCEAANDNDEIRIAARMMGALPPDHIRRVLKVARSAARNDAPLLERMSQDVREALARVEGRDVPYEQGTVAARATRHLLLIGLDGAVDPFQVLEGLGVPVTLPRLGLTTLDALSIWGASHGPAVMINAQSRRLMGKASRAIRQLPEARITAAHELCHLLLDRERALGAVDILDGRMPLAVEQRARAYAAEFMLPAETAVSMWRSSRHRVTTAGVESILQLLQETFNVTRIVARNQLEHGLNGSEPNTAFVLDQLVPRRG